MIAGSEPGYFGLHPEGTEQNGLATAFPDQVDRFGRALSVIAIDQNDEPVTTERVGDGLPVRQETRFHSTKLDHQTQQRRDHFFARENQNVTQKPSRKNSDRVEPATYGPESPLARCGDA
jgi:hypothetical protein